jgi:hypothetical protein
MRNRGQSGESGSPNEEAVVETTEALEDRSGDQRWDTGTNRNSGPRTMSYKKALNNGRLGKDDRYAWNATTA